MKRKMFAFLTMTLVLVALAATAERELRLPLRVGECSTEWLGGASRTDAECLVMHVELPVQLLVNSAPFLLLLGVWAYLMRQMKGRPGGWF